MAPPTFAQKCLAFHGPMLYEAKTLKIYDPETRTTYTKATAEAATAAIAAKGVAPDSETANATAAEVASEGVPNDLPSELQDKMAYYIHYKGWKSTWDEWVSDERVLAWNEENLRTRKELMQIALAAANKKKSAANSGGLGFGGGGDSAGGGGHADGGGSGLKRREGGMKDELHGGRTAKRGRGPELDLEKEEDFIRKPEVSLTVPDPLKAQLVDDWEYVTKEHQVVPLPREITVVDLLKSYRESVPDKTPGSTEADIFDEVMSGIKLYFDRALGNILLYRFERQQYLAIKKKYPDTPMSEIYGPEHLLRLFVSFPALIAQTNMDQQSIVVLREHLEDCLRYMVDNRSKIFLKEYENTSPQYENVSRGF